MSYSLWPHRLQPSRLLCPLGFSRQEYWSGLSCCSPGDLPDLEIEPMSLMSPALAGGFFTASATWEASSVQFSSVPSLSHVQLFAIHGPQHARPPCSSLTPGVYSDSCLLSWWCHPTISSSVIPFTSCLLQPHETLIISLKAVYSTQSVWGIGIEHMNWGA